MRTIVIAGLLLLCAGSAYSQQVANETTVTVPANGRAGGTNAAIWSASCKEGMVMTGIDIMVGGTCNNQCDADGRPIATYRIRCTPIGGGKSIRAERTEN
jgi:hypothetical protein